MNLRCGQRHSAAHVLNTNPYAVEIRGAFLFGNDAERALLHHLRDEAMRVHDCPAHGHKERAVARRARVVRHVRDNRVLVSRKLARDHARHLARRHRPEIFLLLSHHQTKIAP